MTQRVSRGVFVLAVSAIAAVILVALSLTWSSLSIPIGDVVRALFGGDVDPTTATIVRGVRLPRTLAAAGVGAALGLAGLIVQTLFRNPLADPFVLGISSGAGLGVALAVLAAGTSRDVFGVASDLARAGTVVAAFMGSLAVLSVVLVVASVVRQQSVVILFGVVIASVVEAATSILVYFADEQRTRAFVEWSFGSFQRVRGEELLWVSGAGVISLLVVMVRARSLDALLLGEDYARTMGVRVRQTRITMFVAAALCTATAVAFAGPIAFLGLAIPHVARSVLGDVRHVLLAPLCVLIGASLGMGCGILAELPGSSASLPANAATALIAGPIVLWVLTRVRTELT